MPLPAEETAGPPIRLSIEGASATPRAPRSETSSDGDDATENEAAGASATPRASPPCSTNKTITITNDNPICARAFSQSQDKAAGASATPRARPQMPTPGEKLAMQSAQRTREGADPPRLGDALNEFLSGKRESFHDALRRIEAQIRETVSDPSLAESRIAGTARRAGAEEAFYSALMGALKAIATKFGGD